MEISGRRKNCWLPQIGSGPNDLCKILNSLDIVKFASVFLKMVSMVTYVLFCFLVHNDLLDQKQTIPSFTDTNLSCLVNTGLHPCLKKLFTLNYTIVLHSSACFLLTCHQHYSHGTLNPFYLFILYYTTDLFTNSGRSFRFPGLILCFCCC